MGMVTMVVKVREVKNGGGGGSGDDDDGKVRQCS